MTFPHAVVFAATPRCSPMSAPLPSPAWIEGPRARTPSPSTPTSAPTTSASPPQSRPHSSTSTRACDSSTASTTRRRSARSPAPPSSIPPAPCATGASRSPTVRTSTRPWTRRAESPRTRRRRKRCALKSHATAAGARVHRGGRAALRGGPAAPIAPRLDTAYSRAMAAGRQRLPRRSRRRDPVRRIADGPPPVELLAAGRDALPGHHEIVRQLRRVIAAQPEPPRRLPLLHPRRRGGEPAGRRAVRRAARAPHAGRRPHGPHARAHLHPRGAVERRREGEPARHPHGRGLHRGAAPDGRLSARVLPAQHPLPRLRLHHGGPERAGASRRPRRSPPR